MSPTSNLPNDNSLMNPIQVLLCMRKIKNYLTQTLSHVNMGLLSTRSKSNLLKPKRDSLTIESN